MNDISGVLSISSDGNLVLHDSGNLVLIQNDSKTVIWQSFDHPTDTLLPYAGIGVNKRTGQSRFLQSWKTEDDPGSGSFSVRFNTSGKSQLFVDNNNAPWWRISFNGEMYVGNPFMKQAMTTVFNMTILDDDNEVAFGYNAFDKSIVVRAVAVQSGSWQVLVWDSNKKQWNRYWYGPKVDCDMYGSCGANGNCDSYNYAYFKCFCLPGFEPKNPTDWYQRFHRTEGCVRKKGPSMCGNGEGFVKVGSVKIPDTSSTNVKMNMSMEECERECLRNCSCNAYAAADVRNGESGRLACYGTLMDTMVLSEEGHALYVRVDAIELAKYARKPKGGLANFGKVGIAMACAALVILLTTLSVYIVFGKENMQKDNGQDIAVKRLSTDSGQGIQEFMNEIKVIAKLQHRNLVKLLGYCIHKEERMLIYEYLPNKSLDFFLFDKNHRMPLDWDTRFHIIFGIARGLLYLHQDSRLKIIHRDLKASNVLLDATMNPKISDFGMARIFGEDQIQARTRRIVGTYGYMSLEYAMVRQYSRKSDVFSFGMSILLLEIISGKRNTNWHNGRASLNLIGQVWDLWREGKALDIMDSTLGESYPLDAALRCIQIGLLCVQESAFYRPTMLEIVFMLGNEVNIPSPRKPAFLFNSEIEHLEFSTSEILQ
ncbi:hypothetical protein K1719_022689 [Acacia pycnantha]|nr:hypothetical protein K1719_022689 [Acacia pycnantha]